MWWSSSKDKKKDEELKAALERIAQLERDHLSLALTLQNLQSAILAISKNNDLVANDVRNIQEMVSHFLTEIDPAQLMFGFSMNQDDN